MLKYLVLVLVVLALVWLLRGARGRSGLPPAPSATPPPKSVQDMVSCAHCGVHLPVDEALPGRGGVFCGEAHRTAFEKNHPAA